MTDQPRRLLDPNLPWFDPQTGRPSPEFYQYMRDLDEKIRGLIEASDDHETRIYDLENP